MMSRFGLIPLNATAGSTLDWRIKQNRIRKTEIIFLFKSFLLPIPYPEPAASAP